jgi:hypothetical protein
MQKAPPVSGTMATLAIIESAPTVVRRILHCCAFSVVTCKAFSRRMMIFKSNESLFASKKQSPSGMVEIGMAVIAAQAFRSVCLVVKNHPPLRTAAVENQRNPASCPRWPRCQKQTQKHTQSHEESGPSSHDYSPSLRVENAAINLGD